MGSIPVLNDNQMSALRRIVGTNQKIDLTVAPRSKSRRLPEYAEEAVSDSEYNGYFKAILVTKTENGQEVQKVKIINGADPESEICGHTDIGNVNTATLDFEAGKSIYLTATYANSAWTLSFVMAAEAPNEKSYEIAACYSGGMLSQVWNRGVIYFGERFWI